MLTSLAPIGGSADDKMTATSVVGFGPCSRIRSAGGIEPLISVVAAVVLAVATRVVPGWNTTTPASAEGDGMVPRGTDPLSVCYHLVVNIVLF